MALDGIFLHKLCGELSAAVGCHIDKIYQPSRDELILLLRSPVFSGKMFLSAKNGAARIHFTGSNPENPSEPPAFCKLLRKHIGGARIVSVEQDGTDRTVTVGLSAYNEMGDRISLRLIAELFGSRPNIILCGNDGRILDAVHRSDFESSSRLIQPGAPYEPAPKQNKLNPLTASAADMHRAVTGCQKTLGTAFTALLDGVSPLVSRELAAAVSEDIDLPACSLSQMQKSTLLSVLERFSDTVRSGGFPCLAVRQGKKDAAEFSYMPITQYGADVQNIRLGSYSELLDEFYGRRDHADRIRHQAQDILKLLNTLKSRTERKLAYRLDELEKCKNREHLRIYGELLKANLQTVQRGAEFADLPNYYDENLTQIRIPLNPALTPSANAAKYFKDYKRSYTAEQTLSELTELDKKELVYLDSVLDALSRAETSAELAEIREELSEAGYIRRNPKQKTRAAVSKPKEFVSKSGFKILVGKNNRENDQLTLKTAGKTDIWLHTKNIPGSHVIILTDGKTPDTDTVIYAARLAAAHSKAAGGENIPVDYTQVKNVKKPSGAKPGMVIYTSNKTVYVRPEP